MNDALMILRARSGQVIRAAPCLRAFSPEWPEELSGSLEAVGLSPQTTAMAMATGTVATTVMATATTTVMATVTLRSLTAARILRRGFAITTVSISAVMPATAAVAATSARVEQAVNQALALPPGALLAHPSPVAPLSVPVYQALKCARRTAPGARARAGHRLNQKPVMDSTTIATV